jgi:hypothetical protein
MWVSGQRHAPAALNPRGKDPRHPLDRRLGGPQSWYGHRCYRKYPLVLPGIEPRSPCRPVLSQTLHWLSYPAPITNALTNSMEQIPVWETEEMSLLLRNQNANNSDHYSPTRVPNLSHMNPIHTPNNISLWCILISHSFYAMGFRGVFSLQTLQWKFLHISHLPHARYISHPALIILIIFSEEF